MPGLLHIVNNCLKELASQLQYFETFYSQLQKVEGLWKAGRLARFIHFCVKPHAPPEIAALFLKRKLGSLYLGRWNEICRFCLRLKEVLPWLRALWNEKAFQSGSNVKETDAASFQPSELTAVLNDPFFMAYFDMVLGLSSTIEQLGCWCESCPCHEDLLPSMDLPCHVKLPRSGRKATNISKLFGCSDTNGDFRCPMRGKRLPELVAYGLQNLLEVNHQNSMMHLLVNHRSQVSPEKWCVLVADLERGKHAIELEMAIKLEFTQRLPYQMAVLGLSDVSFARRKMSEVIRYWDSQSAALQEQHHALSRQLLTQGSAVRSEVDRFLLGEALSALPALEHVAGCFRLVQISERYLEASHSILKRKVAPNSSGPVISLSRRLWRLTSDIAIAPSTLTKISDMYEEARNIKMLPSLLGLSGHPDLVGNPRGTKWAIVKTLNRVLYRCDVAGQYQDVRKAKEFDCSHQSKRRRLCRAMEDYVEKEKAARNNPIGYDAIRLFALQQHMLTLSEQHCDGVFCLKIRLSSVPHVLQDFPTALHSMKKVVANANPDPLLCLVADVEQPALGELNAEGYAESYAATEDGGDPVEHVFFRIVHAKPSSRKTVPLAPAAGIGARLKLQDVAIHVYDKISFAARNLETWLDCSPKSGQLHQVVVLRNLPKWFSFEELSDGLMWGTFSGPGDCMYQLDRCSLLDSGIVLPHDSILFSWDCSRLLTRMFSSSSSPVKLLADSVLVSEMHIIDQLTQANLLSECADGNYEVTNLLLSHLKLVRPLGALKTVASSVDVEEPTLHCLLQQLEEQGFEWEPLKGKQTLVYEVGKNKRWGTRGQEVFPEFLQCLLSASELEKKYGITEIPCGQTRKTYVDLLQGHKVSEKTIRLLPDVEVARNTKSQVERRNVLKDLGPDLAIFALQNFAVEDGVDANAEMFGDEWDLSNVVENEAAPVEVDTVEEDNSVAFLVEDQPLQDPVAAIASDPAGRPQVPDPRSKEANLAASMPSHPNPGPDGAPGQPDVSNYTWGAFRITFKKTGKQMAVQATCPFHAKNNSTGCKKSLNITPFTQVRLDEQLLLLKHWCNQALKFTRQRDHMSFPLQAGSVPDLAVIEAHCIPRTSKPDVVKTDLDLDQQERGAARASNQQPTAEAKAKVVPSAKAKQASRPSMGISSEAVAGQPAAAVSAAEDSSSSSSSSSSSVAAESDSSDSSESGSSSSSRAVGLRFEMEGDLWRKRLNLIAFGVNG